MRKNYAMEIYFALEGINHGTIQANEKFALDEIATTDTETRKGTRKPGNRGTRRKATAKAKRHLQEIYPFTYSVKETVNGGYIRIGNTWEWHPVWKKLDKRASRHEGKEICRNFWEEDLTEIHEEEFWDEDPEGFWCSEIQEFVGDFDDDYYDDDYYDDDYYDDDDYDDYDYDDDLETGYYFVVTTDDYDHPYNTAIIDTGKEYTILSYYYGNGKWDNEILSGTNYRMKRVIIPDPSEI